MKYIVTKKHGWLKKGLILENYEKDISFFYTPWSKQLGRESYSPFTINCWEKNKWVKKVNEPMFTRKQLKDFTFHCAFRYGFAGNFDIEKELEWWLKNK
jgi:hypothetical protein